MSKLTNRVVIGALLTLGIISGCASNETSNEEPTATVAASQITPSQEATKEATPASASQEETQTNETRELTEEEKELLGHLDGDQYSNDKLGVSIRLPENWTKLGPETVQEMNGNEGLTNDSLAVLTAFPGTMIADTQGSQFNISIDRSQGVTLKALFDQQKIANDMMKIQMQASASELEDKPEVTFNEVQEDQINGHIVYTLITILESKVNNEILYIQQSAVEIDGYYVTFSGMMQSNEDIQDLQTIMQSLQIA